MLVVLVVLVVAVISRDGPTHSSGYYCNTTGQHKKTSSPGSRNLFVLRADFDYPVPEEEVPLVSQEENQ